MRTKSETTADATISAARTKTLLIGGGLLLLGGTLEYIGWFESTGPFEYIGLLGEGGFPRLLVLASAAIFAVGVGPGASLVGKRTIARIALILVGFASVLSLAAAELFMGAVALSFFVPRVILQPTMVLIAGAGVLIPVTAAVIAGVHIGRARVLPNPWAWIPLPMLVLGVAVGAVRGLIDARLTDLEGPQAVEISAQLGIVHVVLPLVLGGFALVAGVIMACRRAASSR